MLPAIAIARAGAERVVDKIKQAGGQATAVQGSVARSADVERILAETEKAIGKVNVLVNNAGVYKFAPIEQFSDDKFDWMFNTNVRGLLRATQGAVKHFGDGGGCDQHQFGRESHAPAVQFDLHGD